MEEDFDCYSVETDEDYEFDAPQFYDFTRPENDSEIHDVERWFEVSGDYPHSPFVVKLNLEKILCPEVEAKSSAKDSKNSISRHGVSHSKRNGKEKGNPMLQDAAKSKTKPADKLSQPKNSSFMKPTASHLAKLPKAHGQKQSSYHCTRFQRTTARLDQMRSCVGSDNLSTKRQKLEIGYLKKGSGLRHQFYLPHKSSKKVTVPREPELETQLRAQRRRSKTSSENEKQKQSGCNFKAHPPTRKILHARPLPQHRKRKPQSPDFQLPQSKAIQRDNRRSSAKENKLSAGNKLSENKLIGQFNELSLGSNLEIHSTSQLERHSSAKGLNKGGSDSFQAEFCRRHSKPNQCGHMRAHEASMTRDRVTSLLKTTNYRDDNRTGLDPTKRVRGG